MPFLFMIAIGALIYFGLNRAQALNTEDNVDTWYFVTSFYCLCFSSFRIISFAFTF